MSQYLVETRRQAGLLGGREDEGLVVVRDLGVGHALKVPRPLAHLVWDEEEEKEEVVTLQDTLLAFKILTCFVVVRALLFLSGRADSA